MVGSHLPIQQAAEALRHVNEILDECSCLGSLQILEGDDLCLRKVALERLSMHLKAWTPWQEGQGAIPTHSGLQEMINMKFSYESKELTLRKE